MRPDARLLVLAKAPVAGRSKTRLMSAFSAEEAADLADAALRDTLAVVEEAVAVLAGSGLRAEPLLVLDGAPGDWSSPSVRVLPQVEGGLDARLEAAFAAGSAPARRTDSPLPCLLIGMDTPQAPADLLATALLELCDPASDADAHLGPATDGGWWALGLRRPQPDLLLGLPMSTSITCAATRDRLHAAGLVVRELPVLCDVDTPPDAALVAAQAPGTAFAYAYRALREVAS